MAQLSNALPIILACLALSAAARAQEASPPPDPMAGMDHGAMAGMVMNAPDAGMAGISGSMGFHPFQRETASGTAWQPDSSPRPGLRLAEGRWLTIFSADVQAGSGPGRGLLSGVAQAAARYDLDNMDVWQLRLRAGPGAAAPQRSGGAPRGTLDELAASFSHRLNFTDTFYAYAGVAGAPAFGPPTATDRLSRGGDPVAPLGPPAPDPSDGVAGVATGGWVHGDVKVEASAFNGRPPQAGRLDAMRLGSWSARLSASPAGDWSLQASFADVRDGPAERRGSLSAIYTRPWLQAGWWSTTAAFGLRRPATGPRRDGWMLESAVSPDNIWTVFSRAEQAELGPDGAPGRTARLSLGAERDLALAGRVSLGLGGAYALQAHADSGRVFVRLRVR